jgi:hypothetical protein
MKTRISVRINDPLEKLGFRFGYTDEYSILRLAPPQRFPSSEKVEYRIRVHKYPNSR